MKVLVLTEGYPSPASPYSMSFVHSRNIEYLKSGVTVDVISFSAKENYNFEGVSVYASSNSIDFSKYNAVASHAPNLKNHLKTILINIKKINRLVFFIHGHEVLPINEYYPAPYSWRRQKGHSIKRVLQDAYDIIKILSIKLFLKSNTQKVRIIFVSQWMMDQFEKCVGSNISSKVAIINNPVNSTFIETQHIKEGPKKGDFITIRPLDESKYCIDLVTQIANANPDYKFTIYGKGRFFDYNKKPKNLEWINSFVLQKDIPATLNNYKAALMPTRLDAQGVMACEIAAFGMPIITSDIPVCREMLESFENSLFISNDDFEKKLDLESSFFEKKSNQSQGGKFNPTALAQKELKVLLDD